jgi:hypothetical protein
MVTIADCGSEAVACEFDGNVKECLTVLATIGAAGSKLPLRVICRGTTIRCEAELRHHLVSEIHTAKLVITHQESGWTNRTVAGDYLWWLPDRVKGQRLCLLWDCFSAHGDEDVKSKAERAQIALEFVPAGLTGEWQPLDHRVFGSLKSRAKALFDEQWFWDDSIELTIATVVAFLLRAWDSVAQDEILGGWNKISPLW